MREFKFRAWDKVNRIMYKVFTIDLLTKRVFCGDSYENYDLLKFEDVELMQYTGIDIQDKVYEGDIGIDRFESKVKVVWHSKYACFALEIIGIMKNRYNFCLKDLVKILGNIYENPELLEVKK